eukprot:CAMPEP_0197037978 /NCGR_PEP_ID=MMETSP1384-20130603/15044_1 /TAXON_ID=29189 /ORGANISM="Ammonia sp." /LENGTH=345 /DNA_ID=CAMNT_0042468365 /DNA_START=38 /DNA_END=1075 /DNA_ORIENTATION=+
MTSAQSSGKHRRHKVHRLTYYMPEDVSIGDIVQLIHAEHVRGIVKFIGEVHCLRYHDAWDKVFGHQYFGIELFEPYGDNNGTIEQEYYFHSKHKHGIFVKRDKIKKIVTINYRVPRITIDDVIYMEQFHCNGRIRYIGKLDSEQPDEANIDSLDKTHSDVIYYGIELNKDRGDNNGFINDTICFSQCRANHGVLCTDRDLSDLRLIKKSHLLLYGFLRGVYAEYIPSDILHSIKSFFNFIHVAHHRSIKLTVQDAAGADKIVPYSIYDVYDMDDCILGPLIYKPRDYNHKYDTVSGVKINTFTDDYHAVFDAMAQQYGATATELKRQLKVNGINELNGLRFVKRS